MIVCVKTGGPGWPIDLQGDEMVPTSNPNFVSQQEEQIFDKEKYATEMSSTDMFACKKSLKMRKNLAVLMFAWKICNYFRGAHACI